jgi:hypothetical protein
MLTEPFQAEYIKNFPVAKIGDWGLAVLTNENDARNSEVYKGYGTLCWVG